MKNIRIERINSEIQKTISHIIDNKIRDPQINSIISVSKVDTTPDLAYCRVYITSYGKTPNEEIVARLKGAAGFIRGELSKAIKLRITPRIEFICDNSVEYSNKIENILKNITYSTKADEDTDDQK